MNEWFSVCSWCFMKPSCLPSLGAHCSFASLLDSNSASICACPLATSQTQLSSIQPTSMELVLAGNIHSFKEWWKCFLAHGASIQYTLNNPGMEQNLFQDIFESPKHMIINSFPLSTHLIISQEISEFWTMDKQMIMWQVWDRCRGDGKLGRRNEIQSLSAGFTISLNVGVGGSSTSSAIQGWGCRSCPAASPLVKKKAESPPHTHLLFFRRVGPF